MSEAKVELVVMNGSSLHHVGWPLLGNTTIKISVNTYCLLNTHTADYTAHNAN